MRIGVPKEIKDNEFRVGLTPSSVAELVHHGHEVLVERGAGAGSGLTDAEYAAAGASLERRARSDFRVQRPDREGQGAAAAASADCCAAAKCCSPICISPPMPQQTTDLLASGATCIAYETVTSPTGGLPLLTPMSEVAGRLAPQVGAHCLEREAGGRGILLGGVPGVPAAEVVILGGGVAGSHAATIALGMGANVTVVDRSSEALRRLAFHFGTGVRTIFSTRAAIAEIVKRADLLIGAVLVPGAAAPKLVTRAMLATMKPGAVIVDVAIDQGGCCETSRPTTHSQPTYIERRHRALLRDQHAGRRAAHLDLRAQQRDAALRAGARRAWLETSARRGSRICAPGSISTMGR